MNTLKQIREKNKIEAEKKYMSWNNKIALSNEGTMSLGLFDKDGNKAKDAARNLVKFLRQNKNVMIIVSFNQ